MQHLWDLLPTPLPRPSLLTHPSHVYKPLGFNQVPSEPLGTIVWFGAPESNCCFQKRFLRNSELTRRAVVTFWEDELVKRNWSVGGQVSPPPKSLEADKGGTEDGEQWGRCAESSRGFRLPGLNVSDWVVTAQLHIFKRCFLFRLCSVTGTRLANTSLPPFAPCAGSSPPAPTSRPAVTGVTLKAKTVVGEQRAGSEWKDWLHITSDWGTPTGARDPSGREGTWEDRWMPAGVFLFSGETVQ